MPGTEDGQSVEKTEDELIQEALAAVADEPDSPTDDTEADQDEPAAGGETGDEQTGDDGDEPTHESTVPYERFKQVNEKAKRAEALEQQNQELLNLLTKGVGNPAGDLQVPTAYEVPLIEGWTRDDLAPGEQVLYDSFAEEVDRIRQVIAPVTETVQRQRMSEAERTLTDKVKQYEASEGITLDDAGRADAVKNLFALDAVYAQRGETISWEEGLAIATLPARTRMTSEKSDAKKKAEEARLGASEAEKRKLAIGQARGTSTRQATTAGPGDMDMEEALEAAWNKVSSGG